MPYRSDVEQLRVSIHLYLQEALESYRHNKDNTHNIKFQSIYTYKRRWNLIGKNSNFVTVSFQSIYTYKRRWNTEDTVINILSF